MDKPRRAPGLEVNEVEDGLIVYQASVDRVHHLNPTASVVFELCDGSRDEDAIVAQVRRLFALEADPRDEVQSCLSRFLHEGLVR